MESDPRAHALTDLIEYPPSLTLHAGNEAMLTFALDASGLLRHIDAVPNGKACGCVCPACGESLVARQGVVRAHSFAPEKRYTLMVALLNHMRVRVRDDLAEMFIRRMSAIHKRHGKSWSKSSPAGARRWKSLSRCSTVWSTSSPRARTMRRSVEKCGAFLLPRAIWSPYARAARRSVPSVATTTCRCCGGISAHTARSCCVWPKG